MSSKKTKEQSMKREREEEAKRRSWERRGEREESSHKIIVK